MGIDFMSNDINNIMLEPATVSWTEIQLTLDYYHPEEDVPGKFLLLPKQWGYLGKEEPFSLQLKWWLILSLKEKT